MAAKSVQYFKDKFKTGYVITEQDYADWLDSFRSSLIGVPLSDTTGLDGILAAYRKLSVKVPVADIDGLTAFVNSLTANFLTTSSQIAQTQITGLVDALSNCTTVAEVQQMISDALTSVTPSIGVNGNWWVNGSDTGVKAAGTDGQNGVTPEIGANGNWWIDGVDTGIPTAGNTKTAYNSEITGVRGEAGSVFTLPEPFYQNTLKLYLDGGRLTPGGGKDYTEINETQFRLERVTTAENSVLVADYVPKKQ